MNSRRGKRLVDFRPDSRFLPRRGWVGVLALVAIAACADVAPPLQIQGSGGIEGFVFFDASEDGFFDPSDGDFAIANVSVAVRNRGTESVFAGGSAQSDANGRFTIASVPVGTHDMWIDTLSVPGGVSICQNPLRVTVFFDETQFTDVAGRPGCLITIAEAKDLPLGEFVVVRGIVTSSPGQIDASRTYIEDATAGGLIFSGSLGDSIEIGDQIEIGAITGQFSNDFEFLDPVTLRSLVPDVVADPQPRLVSTKAIADAGPDYTDPIQGAFIRVEKAQLIAQFGSGSLNIQNGRIDDGSGPTIIRVDDGVADRNNLVNLFTEGLCYNFQGFGANFAGEGQIFLRSMDAADMEVVTCN